MNRSTSFILFLYLCSHISSTRKNENNLKFKKVDIDSNSNQLEHFNKEQNISCFSLSLITLVKELLCSRNYPGKFSITK